MSTRVSPSRTSISDPRAAESSERAILEGMAADFGIARHLAGVPDVLEDTERRPHEDPVARIAALPHPDDEVVALGGDDYLVLTRR